MAQKRKTHQPSNRASAWASEAWASELVQDSSSTLLRDTLVGSFCASLKCYETVINPTKLHFSAILIATWYPCQLEHDIQTSCQHLYMRKCSNENAQPYTGTDTLLECHAKVPTRVSCWNVAQECRRRAGFVVTGSKRVGQEFLLRAEFWLSTASWWSLLYL